MITILDGILTIPEDERFIGFYGDNLHTQKAFLVRNNTESGWLYRIYLTFDDGRNNFFILPSTVTPEGTKLVWDVTREQILKSGIVKAQIKAFSNDEEVYHTTSDIFIAGFSTEEDDSFKNGNSEFLQYERTLNELYVKMNEASAKMPYVGNDGYWYTYDIREDKYVNSGIKTTVNIGDNTVTPDKLDRKYLEQKGDTVPVTDILPIVEKVAPINTNEGTIEFINVQLDLENGYEVNGICLAFSMKTEAGKDVYLFNVEDGTSWVIESTGEDEVISCIIRPNLIPEKFLSLAKYWKKSDFTSVQIKSLDDLFVNIQPVNSGGTIHTLNVNIEHSGKRIAGLGISFGVKFGAGDTVYFINTTDGTFWKIDKKNTGEYNITKNKPFDFSEGSIESVHIANKAVTPEKLDRFYASKSTAEIEVSSDDDFDKVFSKVVGDISFINIRTNLFDHETGSTLLAGDYYVFGNEYRLNLYPVGKNVFYALEWSFDAEGNKLYRLKSSSDISDAQGYYNTKTVEGAFEEIGAKLYGLENFLGVY